MNQDLPKEIKDALNKEKYGWTKWGGSNHGLVQENLTNEWYCQACRGKQTETLTPYMFEYTPREYIRICSKCHFTRIKHNIEPLQFDLLLDLVRYC